MVILALLATEMASTPANCTKGTEDQPPLCAFHLLKITPIKVEKNGARAWKEMQGPESCAPFRLSEKQVRWYFAKAKATDAQSVDATLARAPCYASGHIGFANGQNVEWRIEQYGVGTIDWPRGKPTVTYCATCKAKPFIQ